MPKPAVAGSKMQAADMGVGVCAGWASTCPRPVQQNIRDLFKHVFFGRFSTRLLGYRKGTPLHVAGVSVLFELSLLRESMVFLSTAFSWILTLPLVASLS
jgi:hypothetical protein